MKGDGDVVIEAARTLERMRDYLHAGVPHRQRAEIFARLSRLPLEELASMNPVQAEHAVESAARSLTDPQPGVQEGALVCATRASVLALTQTRLVASRLARTGIATTILQVSTTGDRIQDRPLAAIGLQSLFVKELEIALRDGRAHYAVHSCKDLPSAIPSDMQLAAISAREDPRDAFCSEAFPSFQALPRGARVGTSSLRRRAQLAALRSDLEYADLRGNVDTRLRKLREGQYDAIVLACAGLARLNAQARYTVPFSVEDMVPAAGQGALAIEVLAGSSFAEALRSALNDAQAERAVLCERAALAELRGGCQAPIGIHAQCEGDTLAVTGAVAAPDGSMLVRERLEAPAAGLAQARALGVQLARALLTLGAERLLAAPKDSA